MGKKDLNRSRIALENSLFTVSLYDKEKLIGFGRVVGDGGITYVVSDIMADTAYQRRGVADRIMNAIDRYFAENTHDDSYICLIAESHNAKKLKNARRVREAFFTLLKCSIIFSAALWLFIMLCPHLFAGIFTSDSELVRYTAGGLSGRTRRGFYSRLRNRNDVRGSVRKNVKSNKYGCNRSLERSSLSHA